MKKNFLARTCALMLTGALALMYAPGLSEVVSMSVFAEEASGTCGANLTWSLDDSGTLTISGTGDMYNYDVFDGGNRAPWYSNLDSITQVTIEDGVTSVGADAFFDCGNLTSITIPNSVTSIGDNTFYLCSNLTEVTIPDSITSIGYCAFLSCSSLTNITIPSSVTSIGDSAFADCTSLESITIPDSVTSIGDYAFERCSRLTSISIPDSVTSIGAYAFGGCTNLTKVTIPDSITSIGNYTFNWCSNLTEVTIPDSITSIGDRAFLNCSSLTSITIPNGVYSIGSSAFSGCSGLTNITIADGVTSIGNSAFSGCTGLTSITIPGSVTSIGDGAFSGCTGLTTVIVPNISTENAGIPSTASKITYTVDGNGNVTITGVTPGTGQTAVEIPGTIGGKPVVAVSDDVNKDLIGEHNHTSDGGTITKEPTETTEGEKTYKCTICGEVIKTETIPAVTPTHTHSYGTAWKSDSTSHWHECSCGAKSGTAAHVKDDGVTIGEKITYTCTVCGYSWTEEFPTGEHVHSFGTEWKSDNTFHWHECDCGEKSDVAIHVSDGGVITTPATSTTAGVMTYTCTVCGYSWTSEIAPTGTYSPSGSTGTTSGGSTSNVITVTGLSGARAYGYNGTVEVKITDMKSAEDAGKKAMEQLGVNYFYYAFDISLYDKNGNPLTLGNSESITLEIPVPDNMQASQNIVLYHIPGGVPEKISSTTFNKNGKKYVRFNANKFSPYMMVAMDIEDVSSGSGADGNAEPIEPVSRSTAMPDAVLPENKKSRKRRRYRIVNITKEGV